MRRTLRGLEPIDEDGTEALRRFKIGSEVLTELKQPRNIRSLRLYWALVTLVWQNLPEKVAECYPTKEDLSDALKLSVGHVRTVQLPSGKVERVPRSIAFKAADETEFAAFLDRVITLVIRHFLPTVTEAQLRAELESMCGIAPPARRAA